MRKKRNRGVNAPGLKARLFHEDNGCYYCKRAFPIEALTIDHIVPYRVIGKARITYENAVLACQSCNVYKGGNLLGNYVMGRSPWILPLLSKGGDPRGALFRPEHWRGVKMVICMLTRVGPDEGTQGTVCVKRHMRREVTDPFERFLWPIRTTSIADQVTCPQCLKRMMLAGFSSAGQSSGVLTRESPVRIRQAR